MPRWRNRISSYCEICNFLVLSRPYPYHGSFHSPRWRNGRRAGLKNPWRQLHEGSTPSLGTILFMLNVTELRAGTTFKDSQGIWEVIKYSHTKMGRGSATIRIKVKNLRTDATIEKTFTSGQKVDELPVVKKKGQFLYSDADRLVFMDPASFEQFDLPKSVCGGKEKFLQEGEGYDLFVAEDKVLSIEIPKVVTLSVKETGPGVKGNTVSATTKDATLENGLSVKVPLFISDGDKLKIDTRTGEYIERVK